MNKYFFLIFPFIFYSCSSSNKNVNKEEAIYSNKLKQDISKDVLTKDKYHFITTDSIHYQIQWPSKNKINTRPETYNEYQIQKIWKVWETKDYIKLGYSSGSDTWSNIYLSLIEDKSWEYSDVLYEDTILYTLVQRYANQDTVMMIRRLNSDFTKAILEKESCYSAIVNYCIDSIEISNDSLFYVWNKTCFKDKKVSEYREIKISSALR